MIGKKINQLATELSPATDDLTIIGDPVTGVSKKITLLQIANLFATTGTVSSVAVTETGNALTITGSPITSAGTINIGFAGAAAQYVRGDGTLADFPTFTGGGSSVSYYLNSSVSQGTIGGVAYRELSKNPIFGTGTDISISADGYIASYLTDAGDPAFLNIPAGNWNFETYFSASSGGGTPSFYVELYKYDGTTFTLIASSSSVPENISFGTSIQPYFSTLAVPETVLALTDRLAIRYYVNVSGRTITLHTEDNHLCQVITTFTTGLTALNGLTAQVQYLTTGTSGTDFNISSATATHTFNLPTASATNRGALSSADWTTFNNKQNALTNPITGTGTSGQVAYFNGTNSITSNAAFAFTPTSQLLVNNSVTAASAIARGTNLTPTLTAAANFDVLVGLEISPTFTNGAFTNVNQIGLRVNGGSSSEGTALSIRKYSNAVASTTIAGSYYLGLGQEEYTNNSYRLIGFGYHGLTPNRTHYPAYIGYQERTTSGSTFGDIIFGTRTATTDVEPSERMRIFSTGNVGINTGATDAGFRLDVNGTARVQNDATFNRIATFNPPIITGGTTTFSVISNGRSMIDIRENNRIFLGSAGTEIYIQGGQSLVIGNSGLTVSAGNWVPSGSTNLFNYTGNWTNIGSAGPNFGNVINLAVATNHTGTTSTLNQLAITNTINNTGGTSTNRGIFYNPTLTSLTGTTHIAIQTVTGDVLLGTTSGNVAIGTSTLATATELTLGGSQTASSAIARGQLLNTTLVAAANNDVLVGLDINPTFTNGAFTGVSNVGLRVQSGGINVTGNSSINGQLLIGSTTLGINPFLQINSNGRADIVLRTNGTNDNAFSIYAVGGAYGSNYAEFGTNNGLNAANQGGAIYTDSRTGLVPPIRFAVKGTGTTTMSIAGAIQSNGNWGINTTTDAGFRLDVNGTARVQSDMIVNTLVLGRGTGNIATNTAFGVQALNLNTTGNNNTAIGNTALSSNLTGVNNTATGSEALYRNTGTNNTAFGNGASREQIAANANTSVGQSALYNNSTGSNNTAIGRQAGAFIADGSTANAITDNSIYIGFLTRALANNQTNQIVIGHQAIGLGSNTTVLGNTSTTLTALYGSVITGGTSVNASAQLQVDSTSKGFLVSRMTSAQRVAIASPATGLLVYQTDGTEGFYVYSGGSWKSLTMTTI